MASRPWVRWWWPGASVDDDGIAAQLADLRELGFGGAEIQPLSLHLESEEPADPTIHSVGSPGFFSAVRSAIVEARRLGLGLDVTLGSGWPTGGLLRSRASASRQLLPSTVDVDGPATFDGPLPAAQPPAHREAVKGILPVVGPFDSDAKVVAVVTARLADASASPVQLADLADLTAQVRDGHLRWEVPAGRHRIFAFYEAATSHLVLATAFPGDPAESLVVDHLDRGGFAAMREVFADPLLDALGRERPDAFFIDSFELFGELPWTSSLRDRFVRERGYDPTPWLPLLLRRGGEGFYLELGTPAPAAYVHAGDDLGARAREDYEEARSSAFIEEFLLEARRWAEAGRAALRVQAHGGWADVLDAYAVADVPESEGLFAAGRFDFMKLAASAAHVAGRRIASSESFVSLSATPRGFSLDDFHLLAGHALSAGINRLIWHGFPYRRQLADGEPWYPFEAPNVTRVTFTTRLDESHPIWPDLPRLNATLGRLSYAMSRGEHRAGVAWLLPEREIGGGVAASADPRPGESETSRALRAAGLVYDRVSRRALAAASPRTGGFSVGQATYGALLVSDLTVAEPELLAAIEAIAAAGAPVVWLGAFPGRAPGLADMERRDAATRAAAERLRGRALRAAAPGEIAAALERAGIRGPLVPAEDATLAFAVEHRATGDADLLLVFNAQDTPRTQALRLTIPAGEVSRLDPESGAVLPLAAASGGERFELSLPARRAVVLLVRRGAG